MNWLEKITGAIWNHLLAAIQWIGTFLKRSNRIFLEDIDRLERKLLSDATINEQEYAKCHAARLMTTRRNSEQALRSIQSLGVVQDRAAVAPAVDVLCTMSKRWRRAQTADQVCILLGVIASLRKWWR